MHRVNAYKNKQDQNQNVITSTMCVYSALAIATGNSSAGCSVTLANIAQHSG